MSWGNASEDLKVRKSKGLKKLNWEERSYKLTDKGRHEFSKW